MTRTLLALTALLAVVVTARAESPPAASLGDKTFVAWVTLADLQQRGTGIITLENLPGQFDSMVLGEIVPQKWMAGSDFFRRTQKGQADLASETADSSTLVHRHRSSGSRGDPVAAMASSIRALHDGQLTGDVRSKVGRPARTAAL
ncbi:MAG: hypothetical protein U0794_11840 [Isosphaeraceae bacterium]